MSILLPWLIVLLYTLGLSYVIYCLIKNIPL
jgi:hypothetical protein